MKLHIIKNYRDRFSQLKGSELTDALVSMLMSEDGNDGFHLARTEKGKPYDKEGRVFFSVSHTDSIFGLVMASFNIGLDLQKPEKKDYTKIALRYFMDDEIEALEQEGFLKLWTRKEALSKYMGVLLSDVLSNESVINRKHEGFIDLELENGIVGSICVPAEEEDNEISISYRE